MKQRYELEVFESYDNINLYTIRLESDSNSEAEKFFLKFPYGSEYDKDVDEIISWIDKIAETGALERYFRPEGPYQSGISALPIDLGNSVRLYCIRYSDNILIIGNGGIKDADTWQNSSSAEYVRFLIDTIQFIKSRLRVDPRAILPMHAPCCSWRNRWHR